MTQVNDDTLYIITDGTRYIYYTGTITQRKLALTTHVAQAATFTLEKANNLLTHFPRHFRMLSDAWKVIESDITPSPSNVSSTPLKMNAAASHSDNTIFESEDFNWSDFASTLDKAQTDAEVYKERLSEQLSYVDREISDIHHYIEFCNLDAYRGYKCYRLLQDCIRDRRHIKDELNKVSMLLNPVSSASDLVNLVRNEQDRTYTPRILKALFEDGI